MKLNPFGVTLSVLNMCAAAYEFNQGNFKMGCLYICYGIASGLLAYGN